MVPERADDVLKASAEALMRFHENCHPTVCAEARRLLGILGPQWPDLAPPGYDDPGIRARSR
ncbi:hypothetical protein NRB56_64670 [Nocardia sp. RB56]|uniref:Uncharacterized protein n=2 Tax=Nocardia aurantia TaxID=2585199 RepID=A0A7K0DYI2_9NOCA|nr:hypothetical protein [Nocardia aurantia]